MSQEIRSDHVAIYIRWSTDDQASGTTLAVQREGCEFYLRSQGWQVAEDLIFVDDGFSGSTLDRPGIARLRQLVRSGEIDCVVVLKIDRLSRNIVDAVNLVLREWAGRCHLKSVREPIDTTTDLGRMIFGILAMFADFERATIRDRTQTGKTRRIAEGKQLHAEPAFGYMLHPSQRGRWVENPDESPLVRRVFQLAAQGVSANQICRQLNQAGIRTRAGKEWSVRAVLWLLHNRTYIGEVVYGRTSLRPVDEADAPANAGASGTLAQRCGRKRLARITHAVPKVAGKTDAAPALVDAATFDAAQERLAANRRQRMSMGSKAMASPHLLVGIARCPCGGALAHKVQMGRRNRQQGRDYRHYICVRSRQGTCDQNGHIPAQAAEQMVELQFLNLFGLRSEREERFLPSIQAATAQRASLAASLRTAESELARLEADDRRLLRDARSGKIALNDLHALRASIDQDRNDLKTRLELLQTHLSEAEAKARALAGTLRALDAVQRWASLQPWEKRQLLRMVLAERITICRPKGSAQITIDPVWAF